MNRNKFSLCLFLALLFLVSGFGFAQSTSSEKLNTKYNLKEVVVLSRHNIRAPLSTSGSALSKATTKQWTEWTSNASELTLKGGALETMMGQYFRKWLESEKLFTEGFRPTPDDVNIYANSMQRTIATARYFSAGFSPVQDLKIYHRFEPSKMDPVFFPRLTKVTDTFKNQAMKEINSIGGMQSVFSLSQSLQDSYQLVEKVIDMKNSPLCKEGQIKGLDDYNTPIKLVAGEEPHLGGSLLLGTKIADALILQYYEEPNDSKAGFGKKLSASQWEKISKIKDVYGDVLFSAPIVAVNVAYPLIAYMKDELESKDRKLTFLVGHDSNICSVTSALGVESYSLPNTIEKKTPIGSKLIFEKWEDKATKKVFFNVALLYQTTDQLRFMQPLSLSNPPAKYRLKMAGLKTNEDGLYSYDDIIKLFDKAMTTYKNIK